MGTRDPLLPGDAEESSNAAGSNEITGEDILNPKNRKNLLVPEILEKDLGKVTRYSQYSGKRWTHLRVTSHIQSTSQDTFTYIECLVKPLNGTGYDEVVNLIDTSSNIPQYDASVQVSGNTLYLRYHHNAVTQYLNNNTTSATPSKAITIVFNSGFTKDVIVLFPLVTKNWMQSHFIGNFNSVYTPNTIYQVTDCDEETLDIYGISSDLFRHKGSTNTSSPHYVFTKFGWVSDPGGNGINLEWLSKYETNQYWIILRNSGWFEWAADLLGGQAGLGSNGFVTPDYNQTDPQEYHRIDVVIQDTPANFLSTINNQVPLDWAANNATPLQSAIFTRPEFSSSSGNWYNSNDTTGTPVISGTDWNSYLSEISNKVTAYFSYSVYYAENITPCLISPLYEYWVCDDSDNPSNYLSLATNNGSTSSSSCNNVTIPSTDVPGGANYAAGLVTLHHNQACCTVCTLLQTVSSINAATYNTSNGAISWSATDPAFSSAASGNSWASGSMYTVSLIASNGQTVAQTMTAAGGSTTNVTSCVVNDTAGTAYQVTCPSSTLVAPGQKITGHTWYDATSGGSTVSDVYVGSIITGTPGNDVTVFTVEDIYETPVYSQSDATLTLAVGAGFYGEFHSLAPNTPNGIGAGTHYILKITDEDGCIKVTNVIIDENSQIPGCTDSNAINYNSSANVDDQSCILCASGTANNDGLPLSNTSGSVTISLFDSEVINTTSCTNTSTSDGTIDLTTTIVSSVQSVIFASGSDSSQSYTMTLYPVTTQNDFNTAGSVLETKTGILSDTFGASPQHIFGGGSGWGSTTAIPYGYYAIKVQFVDGNETLDIEDCYSIFYVTVKAKACTTPGNANEEVTIPATFLEHDGTLCATPASNGCQLSWGISGEDPCNPILYVEITCVDPADCGVTLQWEFDDGNGYQVIGTNTYTIISVSYVSYATDTGQATGASWFAQYGSGPYKVTMTDCHTSTNTTYSALISANGNFPISGCSSPAALNYNSLANTNCPSTCVYPSWECYAPGDCQDPWYYNGQNIATYPGPGTFITYDDCINDVTCGATPRLGCIDPCAINFDSIANTDDGSCYYGACLDSNASSSSLYWDCDCNGGSYNPSATVNKPECCTYSCGEDPIVTDTAVASTGDCNGGIGGEVAITVTLVTSATNWEVYYEDNTGTVINTDLTVYSSEDTATPVTGLVNGPYTAIITDNQECVYVHNFSIAISGPDFGCMDPADDCYDSNAVCDDGTCCGICGCMDPNATNFNPSATSPCPCNYPSPSTGVCVPGSLPKILSNINSCLILNGTSWLDDYKIGFKEDCTTMDFWKLIFIKYILDQDSLECVYNCEGNYTDIDLTDTLSGDCETLWAQGGQSTGVNHDANHQGTAGIPSSGEGTTVTQLDDFPSGFFGNDSSLSPSSNLTYVGDWISFNLPSSHYLSSKLNGTYWRLTADGVNNTDLHLGCTNQKIGHYTQCLPYTTLTPTVLESGVSYLDNFINFVNNFCKDCGTNILE